jgi:hypothetical protein
MKCIKFYRQHGGHVARVSDDEAAREVKSGRAMYAPKSWWKAARRIEAEGEE